jgi:hypothetical protein
VAAGGLVEFSPPAEVEGAASDDLDGSFASVDGNFGSAGNSEVSACGKEGFRCLARRAAGAFVRALVGNGNGRESKGRGAVVLGAEGGRNGRDGDASGRPGRLIDDDDELADIGSEGENAKYAGTPMSARPNVPAVRDTTRRRAVARGMFSENLLFRMVWTPRRLPFNAEKQPRIRQPRSKTMCLVVDRATSRARTTKAEPNLEMAARRPKIGPRNPH